MSNNNNLHKAKKAKSDEFYTRYEDIEKELQHYKKHFENKVVYCNCDWPAFSEFRFYFENNFKKLKLKKLIVTGLKKDAEQNAYALIIDSNGNKIVPIDSNGNFRSEPCVEFLKEADIVITNPPFSRFREFVAQLMEYDKKFVIVGNINAVTYKEIFPLIKDNVIRLGINRITKFILPDNYEKSVQCRWFTNLDIDKLHKELILCKNYNPEEYPKYDNYDAINVDRVAKIPCDYYETMGVPITFLDKFNPEQFEIVKFRKGDDDKDLCVNGKCPYFRILIKRKNRGDL